MIKKKKNVTKQPYVKRTYFIYFFHLSIEGYKNYRITLTYEMYNIILLYCSFVLTSVCVYIYYAPEVYTYTKKLSRCSFIIIILYIMENTLHLN